MRQSFKRLMSSVIALVSVVAAFAIYFNFAQPAYENVMQLRGELAGMTELLDSQRTILQAVSSLVAKYNESADARAQVALALPEEPMASEALAQLHGLAAIHNLSAQAYILLVSPEDSDRDREPQAFRPYPAKELTFQMKASGSYEDFKKFLDNLETNVRIFDVQHISLQAAGKPNQNLFTYEVRVAAYYQSEEVRK
jgi:Tfp pilus assembly protein PilO